MQLVQSLCTVCLTLCHLKGKRNPHWAIQVCKPNGAQLWLLRAFQKVQWRKEGKRKWELLLFLLTREELGRVMLKIKENLMHSHWAAQDTVVPSLIKKRNDYCGRTMVPCYVSCLVATDMFFTVLGVSNPDSKNLSNVNQVCNWLFQGACGPPKGLSSLPGDYIRTGCLLILVVYFLCKIKEENVNSKGRVQNKVSSVIKEAHLYSRLVSKQQSSNTSKDFMRTKFICWPGISLPNQKRKKKINPMPDSGRKYLIKRDRS